MSINSSIQSQTLSEQNLIPIYFIEDKLQENFKKINLYIKDNNLKRSFVTAEIQKIKNEQTTLKNNFTQKMQQMEKKIVYEISMELQGRIAIAIGKSIDSFTEKIQQKEKNMNNMKGQFEKKLSQMKEELKYEISMENQKNLIKQSKKLQQIVKKGVTIQAQKKNQSQSSKNKLKKNNKTKQGGKQGKDNRKQEQIEEEVGENSQKWQQQHHQILSLESRIQALQQFGVNVDKRVYNGLTSIKQSWKELGSQLLENKKTMMKKFDELRIDFIKLKGLKQFSITPDKIEDQFKRKLIQKFTDIYQLLSVTLTKNQYEASIERVDGKISRHDDELIEMRKQLATNNQFFTFYVNNADQEDLKLGLKQIAQRLDQQKQQVEENLNILKTKDEQNMKIISEISKNIKYMEKYLNDEVKKINEMNQIVSSVKDRIQNLQDFNKFGPDKLQKIHNSLDIDFTATEKQLIDTKTKKNGLSIVEQSQRELRIQLSKIKDQLFLVTSQNQVKDDQLNQMKKNYKELQQKIVKFKGQNQQAMAARKPWVCLSCDKQQKQTKKQVKIRKPEPFKGFGHQRSEKNLKAPPTPPFEQRFEVYEKLRQKYLSDTIKLPQILKQKLKEKETSLHN